MTLTRDNYGIAIKCTYVEINGEGREIFKDPKTDGGMKKSAKGLIKVVDGVLYDQVSFEEIYRGDMKTVYRDGSLLIDQSLSEIRQRLAV